MNYRVLPEAQAEAIAAAGWYDDRTPGLGDQFLDELRNAFHFISSAPEACSLLEEYSGRHTFKRTLLNRFPYMVVFHQRDSELLIVAICHTRRQPLYWLNRLD